jgi:YtxH-like protein
MLNSPSPGRPASSIPKTPLPGSIPQPANDEFPGEMVPDWNNIGLFTAGIAVGAILGAAAALLFAPASGGEMRHRIAHRVRSIGGNDDVWDDLAEELERAASEAEAEQEAAREALEALKT